MNLMTFHFSVFVFLLEILIQIMQPTRIESRFFLWGVAFRLIELNEMACRQIDRIILGEYWS